MVFDFDQPVERRGSNSIKWNLFPPDVLPLWVADMDFRSPPAVRTALEKTLQHGVLGYEFPTKELAECVVRRMGNLYGWNISADAVVATPGVIAGFIAAANTVCLPGDGVLVQPPVYPPFLNVHAKAGLVRQTAPLVPRTDGQIISYYPAIDSFRAGLNTNDARTTMFLLCNPHNPTGQMYSREELNSMAEICLANGTVICSDEIHSELLLDDMQHIPIASLSAEVEAQSITLIAPSKTFNIPGLFCGFAIIPNASIREKYKQVMERLGMHVNSLGLIAAQAAYSGDCDEWLAALRVVLRNNRDFLLNYIQEYLPALRTTSPAATYLAWLDFSKLALDPSPHKFLLEKAKVALNDGSDFGFGGEGFVRLNFGCPRAILIEALERIRGALAQDDE